MNNPAHEAALLTTAKHLAPVLERYGWKTPLNRRTEGQVRAPIETVVCNYEMARWGRTNMVPF